MIGPVMCAKLKRGGDALTAATAIKGSRKETRAIMELLQDELTGITLRPATPDDDTFQLELYTGTRLDELALIDWNEDQKQAFIKMQFNARQLQYSYRYPQADDNIILRGSQPIGRMLVERNEKQITLVDIALLPEHRNAGIGTRLVQSLLDEAAGTGKSVRLHVVTTNPAVRMYERLGFSTVDDSGSYLEMNWAG